MLIMYLNNLSIMKALIKFKNVKININTDAINYEF